MARVLVLFAHPALEKSRVHRRLLAVARERPGVTLHDLYEAYPRLDVDVGHEQRLLTDHDVIVFQFPFYWYSTPPMLKQWQDLVLEHGWAYGVEGTALRGKAAICAVSVGGRDTAYRPEGYNRHTVRQLMAPLEQTTKLCGMRFFPPWIVYGTHRLSEPEIVAAGETYAALLDGLVADRLTDPDPALVALDDLNAIVPGWVTGPA